MPDLSKLYSEDEINYLISNFANTSNNMSSLIKKYTDYDLFIKENQRCYKHIKRKKLDYLLISLERNKKL